MGFKLFTFVDTGSKRIIKCLSPGCSGPEIDYDSEEGKRHYSLSGFISQLNDCRSDVEISCKACGANEIATGIQGIHLH